MNHLILLQDPKMNYKTFIVLTLQLMSSIWMLPMQIEMQRLQHPSIISEQAMLQQQRSITEQPLQESRQLSMTSQLQQQMLALQQLQAMQNLNTIHAPSHLFLPQPFLLLLPNQSVQENEVSNVYKEPDDKKTEVKHNSPNNDYIDEALESFVIDAEKSEEEIVPQKAVLLMPSSRISIGEIISGIPWLPFEVNVPDTIVWAWNGKSSGIAGIISIIGQRLPFRPRPQMSMISEHQGANVKMFLKQLQMKQSMMPILILPLQRPVLPMQK